MLEIKNYPTGKPTNPVILKVWERLQESGALDGLSDDEILEKVVSTAEKLLSTESK
ncbi:MAG: hypothetical protein Q8P30_02815 [Candidatus Uhrbacteria bacterium]|nr:hypothetical protein [Candidatus Uhrbacteria bacterium]